ncbi:hypothetical protein GCM10009414_29030 [Tatumella terrea]|uniref:hypothetical protein n=1 Tax=Tatumella terrea TaxID=419007 RepID=UPI0031DA068F
MKPITEQRRQELIADCEKEIEHAEKLLLSAGLAIGWRKVHENNLLKHQIALASLTAAPEVSEIESVHPENGNTIIHLRRGGLKNISPEDIAEYEMIETEKFYTAPPVPVIKLPDEIEGIEHSEYGAGKKDGWNLCLDEIKRRNGLGE